MGRRPRNDPAVRLSQGTSHTAFRTDMGTEIAWTPEEKIYIELFEQLRSPVQRYLNRFVQNDDLADDLTQETFERVWKGLPSKKPEVPFKSWVYLIATNVVRSYFRHKKLIHWQSLDQIGELDAISAPGPEESICEKELIAKTLARLPKQQQVCLSLKYVAGCSESEIAETLGVSIGTVSGNITRGRKTFQIIFTRMGGDLL